MPPIQEGLLSAHERREQLISSQIAAVLIAARTNGLTELTPQFIEDNLQLNFPYYLIRLTRLTFYEQKKEQPDLDETQLLNQSIERIGARANFSLVQRGEIIEAPVQAPVQFATAA
jgi:hypothetical protein